MRRPKRRPAGPSCRRSRRSRKSLLLVFALVFAPAATRPARAACVEFASPPTIGSANGTRAVFAADLDGDGDLDALAASSIDDRIAWFENLAPGDGSSWTLHTISVAADFATSVFAGDVNGDGDLDVLSSSLTDGTIAWYENDGAPDPTIWTLHEISTAASGAESVFAADVDGDGDLDALSASYYDSTIAWYENLAGDGLTWTRSEIATLVVGAFAVYADDVDDDGDIDALSANAGGIDRIAWYENLGGEPILWTPRTISIEALNAFAVTTADLDSDGDVDALSASAGDDTIAWYENLGGSPIVWTLHEISTAAQSARSASAVDVDGDGDLDVLSASRFDNKVAWYESDGTPAVGPWTAHTISTAVSLTYGALPADLDGDGDADFLTGSPSFDTVLWFRNDTLHGQALFAKVATIQSALSDPTAVAAADVDRDGDLDALVTTEDDGSLLWYENLAPGDASSFTRHTVSEGISGVHRLAPVDLDADGDMDVLSSSSSAPAVAWHENLPPGDGSTWTDHVIASSGNPYGVAAADVDGDGDIDALASSLSNAVWWFENLSPGDGSSWATHDISTIAFSAYDVAAADVDGDGDVDALSASAGDAKIAWYDNVDVTTPGTGNGATWSLHTISLSAQGAYSVVGADLDGDGDIDAVAGSNYDDTVEWYENFAGDGSTWSQHTIFAPADNLREVAVGDLDRDGDLDVLSASSIDNTFAWYENDGTPAVGAWTAHELDTAASAASAIAAADLDGDGDLDALTATRSFNVFGWYENLGTRVHDDGFDSDGATTACWSVSVPPVP